MCARVHVCIYLCVYIDVYVCIYLCVRIYKYIYVCVCVCVCVSVHRYVCMYLCVDGWVCSMCNYNVGVAQHKTSYLARRNSKTSEICNMSGWNELMDMYDADF